MSARSDRPDEPDKHIDPTRTNKYFTETPQTFEEWLHERGGPEAYAEERRKILRERDVESIIEHEP